MPTKRQKQVIEKAKQVIENGQTLSVSKIMREVGYSESTARNPQIITDSKAWQEVIKELPLGMHLQQLSDLGDTRLNQDKDIALKAKDMIFKLTDKYPKGETKIVGIFAKIDSIKE